MTVRVRFAPSPTGIPHVGNIRTALFNWLFARHERGAFILRIEDTDQTRLDPRALEAILESMRWLGLEWDEGPEVGGLYGPYFQSERLPHYRRATDDLIAKDAAYRCFCSPERLEQVRAEQTRRKEPPRYDRRCRNLSETECKEEEAKGIVPVVRFKTPLDGRTEFDDVVRGHVTFENETLDDFVLLKSDGYPTYHLANVVDDHLMDITHVLRADEWLPSTPRHLLLYAALGFEPPVFAHLPMILGPDRAKLSKRHGAVSLLEYRRQGYLPEAMFNFLGLLGWSLDDHTEIISREDFIRHFSLERIVQNPAIFDVEKLTWMNGVYMRALSPEPLGDLLVERLEEDLSPDVPRPLDRDYVLRIVPLVQERIKRLDEAAALTAFFFVEGTLEYPSERLLGKRFAGKPDEARKTLATATERLSKVDRWERDALEGVLRPLADELALKAGDLFMLIRVAITGQTATPPLFETMEVLGRDRCLARLDDALLRLA
jgi:glutamyl-tRNA synthetase